MVSPRVHVAKANYYAPHERIYQAQDPASLVETAYQAEQVVPVTQKQGHELSKDEWKNIQKRIDKEYERKLKEVGDDAMSKLQMYQEEHKALLEKTSYLIDAAEEPEATVQDPQAQKVNNVQNIRKFQQEYNEVLNFGMNVAGELYLVDILKRLHLLPSGDELPTKEHERELYNLLRNSKDNLLIRSDLEQEGDNPSVQDLEGDLTRNLFKVICAILDL